jgi:RHS repeat-associated protein
VQTISRDGESIGYTYDGSLLTGVTLSRSLDQGIGLTYDDDFRLTALTYSGSTESVTHDGDGLLTGLGGLTIGRNADNGLPESVTGGGFALQRGFNTYGEIDEERVDVNGSPLSTIQLERDDNGRIYRKTETLAGATTVYDYTYDLAGGLQIVEQDGMTVKSYQYNTTGTRSYEENSLRGIAGRNLTYSDEDHLLTAVDATYQYDLDGFLTRKSDTDGDTLYDYSSRGELLTVSLPDGTHITYDHDPLGRRIAKRIGGTIVEKYLWQGLTQLLAVYDGADNLIQRFEYADGRLPVTMTTGGVRYYLVYDQVGTLRAVTDGSGTIVKQIDYDSFGNVITDTNPGFSMPFGFAGGLFDTDTGLVRFGYRDYDPATGRWTAKDPIDFAGGGIRFFMGMSKMIR